MRPQVTRPVGWLVAETERGRAILKAEMKMVAEGVKTAKAAYELSRKHDVDMPITEEVYNVLYKDKPARDAVMHLMTRRLKEE